MLFFNKHAFGLLAPVYWYWYCLLAPVIPVWNNSAVLFRGGITARKIQLSRKHEPGSFLVLLAIARMLQLSRKPPKVITFICFADTQHHNHAVLSNEY
jgi:hypothetical protein